MTEHEQMVLDCEKRESQLDDWDRNFIDSIGRQLTYGGGLTPKQAELLERIWNHCTRNG